MRWDNLMLSDESAQEALFGIDDVIRRTFDTPEFRGMTFYEVRAQSILNKVPGQSRMPFEWTVDPYRGCSHACVYCFARRTHEYLDLDAGIDFDSKIVVKVNAPELLRRQLMSSRWAGSHIAMGTNVDPYQRVEGRYRLMPGILEALRDARNPFSILTKGTLVLRDLHLRPGAQEWYLARLERERPELVFRYRELYGRGAYAPKTYRQSISARVAALARRYGVGAVAPGEARRPPVRRAAVRERATVASTSPTQPRAPVGAKSGTNARVDQLRLL
ncbi:MAG: Rv2578c family radical SAM protein [Pseudonocardiaceae bacterium]